MFDVIFRRTQPAECRPADGYLAQPPEYGSIVLPGTYYFNSRRIDVLGFQDNGRMSATLFLCHAGSGCCSEWGTLLFHRISYDKNQETWEAIVDRTGIVISAEKQSGGLVLKIEVDR